MKQIVLSMLLILNRIEPITTEIILLKEANNDNLSSYKGKFNERKRLAISEESQSDGVKNDDPASIEILEYRPIESILDNDNYSPTNAFTNFIESSETPLYDVPGDEQAQNRPSIRRQDSSYSSTSNLDDSDTETDELSRRRITQRLLSRLGYKLAQQQHVPSISNRGLISNRFNDQRGRRRTYTRKGRLVGPANFNKNDIRRRFLSNQPSILNERQIATDDGYDVRTSPSLRGNERSRVRTLPFPPPPPSIRVPFQPPSQLSPQQNRISVGTPVLPTLSDNAYSCVEAWSSWSAASACPPKSCGACEQQLMRRQCLSQPDCPCKGTDVRKEICNRKPCEEPQPPCCADYVTTIYENELSCQKITSTPEVAAPRPSLSQMASLTGADLRFPTSSAEPCCADLRGTWSSWVFSSSRCSDECGGFGRQPRKRVCLSTEHGCPCIGNSDEIIACNLRPCQFPRQTCAPGLRVQMRPTTTTSDRASINAICAPPPENSVRSTLQSQQELPNIRNFADDNMQPSNEILMADLNDDFNPASNVKLFMESDINTDSTDPINPNFDLNNINLSDNQFNINGNDQAYDSVDYNTNYLITESILNNNDNIVTDDEGQVTNINSNLYTDVIPQLKSDRNESNETVLSDEFTILNDIVKEQNDLTNIDNTSHSNGTLFDELIKNLNGSNESSIDMTTDENYINPEFAVLRESSENRKIRRKRQIFTGLNTVNNNFAQAISAVLSIPAINTQDYTPVQQEQGASNPVIGIHPGQLEWQRENQVRLLGNAFPRTSQFIPINPFDDDALTNADSTSVGNGLFSAAPAPNVQAANRRQNQPLFLAIPGQGRTFRDVIRGRSTTVLPGLLVLRRQMNNGLASNNQIRIPSEALTIEQSENTQPSVPPLQLLDNDKSNPLQNQVSGQTPAISAPTIPNDPITNPSTVQPISTNEILTQPSDFYRLQPNAENNYDDIVKQTNTYGEQPIVYYPETIEEQIPVRRYYEVVGQVEEDNNLQYAQAKPNYLTQPSENSNSVQSTLKPENSDVQRVPDVMHDESREFIDENGINSVDQELRLKRSTRFKRQQNLPNIRNQFQQFVQNLRRQLNNPQAVGSLGFNNVSNPSTSASFTRSDDQKTFLQGLQNLQSQQNVQVPANARRNFLQSSLLYGGASPNNFGRISLNNMGIFNNLRGNPNSAMNNVFQPPSSTFGLGNITFHGSQINGPFRREGIGNVPNGDSVPPITDEFSAVPRSNVANETNIRMNLQQENPINPNSVLLPTPLIQPTNPNPQRPRLNINVLLPQHPQLPNLNPNLNINTPSPQQQQQIREQQGQGAIENRSQLSASLAALIASQQLLRQATSLNQQAALIGTRKPAQPVIPQPVDRNPTIPNTSDRPQQLPNELPTSAISRLLSGGFNFNPNTVASNLANIAPSVNPTLTLSQLQQIQSALAVSRTLNEQNGPAIATQPSPNIFIINRGSSQESALRNRPLQLVQVRPGVFQEIESDSRPFTSTSILRPTQQQQRELPENLRSSRPKNFLQQTQQQPRIPTRPLNCCVTGGIWDLWTEWSACSAECGGCGRRTRTRQCASQKQGCPCASAENLSQQSETCNLTPCSFPRSACCENLRPRPLENSYICG